MPVRTYMMSFVVLLHPHPGNVDLSQTNRSWNPSPRKEPGHSSMVALVAACYRSEMENSHDDEVVTVIQSSHVVCRGKSCH